MGCNHVSVMVVCVCAVREKACAEEHNSRALQLLDGFFLSLLIKTHVLQNAGIEQLETSVCSNTHTHTKSQISRRNKGGMYEVLPARV